MKLFDPAGLIPVLEAMADGKPIEMRWKQERDGDTAWHDMGTDTSIPPYRAAQLGLFPFQAEYRVKAAK